MIERKTTLKKLYEVTIRTGGRDESTADTLLVVADDENDVLAVEDVRKAEVVKLVEVPGMVTTVGPSRVIGWTRAAA